MVNNSYNNLSLKALRTPEHPSLDDVSSPAITSSQTKQLFYSRGLIRPFCSNIEQKHLSPMHHKPRGHHRQSGPGCFSISALIIHPAGSRNGARSYRTINVPTGAIQPPNVCFNNICLEYTLTGVSVQHDEPVT